MRQIKHIRHGQWYFSSLLLRPRELRPACNNTTYFVLAYKSLWLCGLQVDDVELFTLHDTLRHQATATAFDLMHELQAQATYILIQLLPPDVSRISNGLDRLY